MCGGWWKRQFQVIAHPTLELGSSRSLRTIHSGSYNNQTVVQFVDSWRLASWMDLLLEVCRKLWDDGAALLDNLQVAQATWCISIQNPSHITMLMIVSMLQSKYKRSNCCCIEVFTLAYVTGFIARNLCFMASNVVHTEQSLSYFWEVGKEYWYFHNSNGVQDHTLNVCVGPEKGRRLLGLVAMKTTGPM
jgi:hypothetical protein